MGDHLQAGTRFLYVTSHPSELSLAIPQWLNTMSTSESWGTARCTSPYLWSCSVKLVCLTDGYIEMEISTTLWVLRLEKTLRYIYIR